MILYIGNHKRKYIQDIYIYTTLSLEWKKQYHKGYFGIYNTYNYWCLNNNNRFKKNKMFII